MKKMQMYGAVGGALAVLLTASPGWASIIDPSTKGNWIGVYGRDGYILNDYIGPAFSGDTPASPANDLQQLPGYVTGYTYSGAGVFGYRDTSFDYHAVPTTLQDPVNPGQRTQAEVGTQTISPFKVSLTLTANAPAFELAIYFSSTSDPAPQTVSLQWVGEGAPFDSAAAARSTWAVFAVEPNGRTQLDIDFASTSSYPAIQVSGIMFATPEPGTLVLLGIGGLVLWWRQRNQRAV